MDSAQNQLVEKLRSSANILVTVSRNPSVDQLSACVGLTLLLNKFSKHATAVFSGEVPSTLEFLDPESTLEKTTDSLRDFIIALDKSKADKLRYKVEDEMVRIFITPYRTSISQADLEFSQGDFNVDVVIALGVQRQEDLDDAITSHGRILHDAVVSSINTHNGDSLGSINWADPAASSLSELVYDLAVVLNKELIDGQIATALLTGIVAETDRFSNEKTTPQTMSVSAALMAAGANQQLVASKLDAPAAVPPGSIASEAAGPALDAAVIKPEPGTLEIKHASDIDAALSETEPSEDGIVAPTFEPTAEVAEPVSADGASDLIGDVKPSDPDDHPADDEAPFVSPAPSFVVDPPMMGGTLTANSRPEYELVDSSFDPLSLPQINEAPLLSRDSEPAVPIESTPPASFTPLPPTLPTPLLTGFTPPPPAWVPPYEDPLHNGSPASEAPKPLSTTQLPPFTPVEQPAEPAVRLPNDPETLADIEQSVHSPHLTAEVNSARDEVMRALSDTSPELPEPIAALNAQPLGAALHEPVNFDQMAQPTAAFTDVLQQVIPAVSEAAQPPAQSTGYGDVVLPPAQTIQPSSSTVTDPTAPPPVPPPIPFNFGTPQPPNSPR